MGSANTWTPPSDAPTAPMRAPSRGLLYIDKDYPRAVKAYDDALTSGTTQQQYAPSNKHAAEGSMEMPWALWPA